MGLSLSLLGQPTISGAGGPVRLSSKKGQALLWYLAAQPDRAFPRVQLSSLLWEKADESAGRRSLSATLHRLRSALPVWPLVVQTDAVGWDPTAGARIDTVRFGECLDAAAGRRSPEGESADAESAEALAIAVSLWRGPFLDGFHLPESEAYEEWLQRQRKRWEDRLIEALAQLVELEAVAGSWARSADHARQALEIDPIQERFHRGLILALYNQGDRAAAISQYERCEQVLRDELNLTPGDETLALRDAIVAGRLVDAGERVGAGEPARASAHVMVSEEAAAAHHTVDGVDSPAPPLVGREEELARIEATLSGAVTEAGRALLLHGEAGIGKTRLVDEIRRRSLRERSSLEPEGGPAYRTVLVGHGYEATQELPYAPFVEALNRLVPTLDVARLGLPDVWLAEMSRLLPDLTGSNLPPPIGLVSTQERHRLFEAMARFLAALPGPTLMILEDVHFADSASVQLLSYLVRSPMLRGVSILVTARPGDLDDTAGHLLRQLQREGWLTWEEIGPLSFEAVRSLGASLAARRSESLADRLHERSRGNPLFAVELLHALQERGAQEPGNGEAPEPDALDALPIPATIRAVVQSRLARLPLPARELVDAAAITAPAASLGMLGEVARLSDADALTALETLVKARILREIEDSRTGVQVTFAHELIRSAVVESITRSRRKALYRRAFHCFARVAGDMVGDSEPPVADTAKGASWLLLEQVVHYAIVGGLWEEGLSWSVRASEAADRAALTPVRARFLDQALRCLDRLPATPDRRRVAVDVRLRLAYAFLYLKLDRVEGWLAPAAVDAERLGDEARRARVDAAWATLNFFQGRFHEGRRRLDRVLPLARASSEEVLLAGTLMPLGLITAMQGEFDRAIPVLDEAARLAKAVGNAHHTVISLMTLALVHGAKGDFATSDRMFRELVRESQSREDPVGSAYSLAFWAIQLGVRGDWGAAAANCREAIRLADTIGVPYQQYLAHLYLGPALAYQGDLAGARTAQERTLALAEKGLTRVWLGHAYAWLGEIERLAGRTAAAEQAARTGLEIAEEQGARYDAALCTKVLGKTARDGGDQATGRARLTSALETFTGLGARPETARCHAALADVSEGAERARHRRSAQEMFREMGMVGELRRLSEAAS